MTSRRYTDDVSRSRASKAMIRDTELRLSFWRDGQTNAERLAASALRLSGYEEIDPQSPLGGPDGKKDLLCRKGGLIWVVAVYFPTGPVRFAALKKKYISDLSGAPEGSQGFAFVTNQNLSPGQRLILESSARALGKEADILHLQRVINLLDSAPGYGVRLQFLNIPMTIEEQLSWSLESDSQTAKALATNTRELLALRASVDRIKIDKSVLIRTIGLSMPASPATPDLISVSSFQSDDGFPPISARLDLSLILLFHRLTCFDLPTRAVGRFRDDQVFLANAEGRMVTHIQPPPQEKVVEQLTILCENWNRKYAGLRSESTKLHAVAHFYWSVLVIHPFWDGNGRVARAILMQQCLDLFGRADMTAMKKGEDYYSALQAADAAGDLAPLVSLINPIVRR
jgi:hypothetical protein